MRNDALDEVATTTVTPVNTEVGQGIKKRRTRLGMSVKALAEAARIDRGRLAAIERGDNNVRPTTLGAVESALDRLEREMGMDDGEGVEGDDAVEFRVAGNFGVDVVVKGPVRDLEALEASVARLVQQMQTERERDR